MNLITQNNEITYTKVICDECKGTGTTSIPVGWSEYEEVICDSCKGSGVLQKEVEVRYSAYIPRSIQFGGIKE